MSHFELLLLLLLAAALIGLRTYDAYRSRRCAWCGHPRPNLRHFTTHHLEN